MELKEFIKPELMILIPVLYLIGMAIKRSAVANKAIPFILGGISIILSGIWVFASSDYSSAKEIAMAIFTAVTQGILIAGASVYVNQLIKQGKDKE